MLLIDQGGRRVRKICDRCHKLRARVARGSVCVTCRAKGRKYQISESTRSQREFMRRALAVQAELEEMRRSG